MADKGSIAMTSSADVPSHRVDQELNIDEADAQHQSTSSDVRNMRRMGRNQELVRHFRMMSMISFVAIATSAWETTLFVLTPALTNGGRAGLVWSSIWSFICFAPIYLSMAEMASMAPIAGAQYHWVSEFAPEKYQKILSYITGWTSTLAWQAGCASGFFEVGTLIQATITINRPDYSAPSWQGSLMVMASLVLGLVANIYGARMLPYWQNAVFLVHILAYIALLVPIWANAPSVGHREVWVEFSNGGGWSSMTMAILVGQITGISAQVGIDTAAHMSEEVKDASKTIPRTIIANYVLNYVLIFITIITMCYHIPNISDALSDSTTYPGLYVIRQSMSLPWQNVLFAFILLLEMFGAVSYMAAVTRDLFAFARDRGLPFSPWIAKVDQRNDIPTNACLVSGVVTILLSLIYIGSPVAFYAVVSLTTVALLQCYALSIGCLLWRRIKHPETLPRASFSLGKYGIPINAAAVAYAVWGFFWCFWPDSTPVTAAEFNWASPIFAATIIFAIVYYFIFGRKNYHGPVTLVEGRKLRDL